MSVEPIKTLRSKSVMQTTQGQDRFIEPQKRSRWRWLVAVAVTGIVLWWLVPVINQWRSTEKSYARDRVTLAPVEQTTFVRDVAAQGVVVAAVSPGVFAPAAGVVTLNVNAGDRVEQNQIIAELASPELNNRLALEQSSLERLQSLLGRRRIENNRAELATQQRADLADVDLTAAKRELRRAEVAWEKRVITLQDYEKAVDDVARAELALDHARRGATLEKESLDFELNTLMLEHQRQALVVKDLERQVSELKLRAPVAGIVGTLAVNQKSNVQENTLIANVVDLSRLEIEVRVPSSYSDALGPGAQVDVTYSGQRQRGELISISPEITNNTLMARVSFGDSMPVGLRQNQRVSARILLEQREGALTLPRGAYYDDGGGRFVYVVTGDVATKRAITTGATSAERIEILSGLNQGEQVIVSSYSGFSRYERVLLTN